jgi:uncharacterized Zn finger protein
MEALYQCPYCSQGKKPHLMAERLGGAWHRCNKCGHTIMPGEVQFQCHCLNCRNLPTGAIEP